MIRVDRSVLMGCSGGIEHVGQIGARGWGLAGLGDLRDDEVGVAGSEALMMGETGLDGGEACWIERHLVRSPVDVDRPGGGIDVGDE